MKGIFSRSAAISCHFFKTVACRVTACSFFWTLFKCKRSLPQVTEINLTLVDEVHSDVLKQHSTVGNHF